MSTYKFIPCDYISRISDGYLEEASDDASALKWAQKAAPSGLHLEVWKGMRFVGMVTADETPAGETVSAFQKCLRFLQPLRRQAGIVRVPKDAEWKFWAKIPGKHRREVAR